MFPQYDMLNAKWILPCVSTHNIFYHVACASCTHLTTTNDPDHCFTATVARLTSCRKGHDWPNTEATPTLLDENKCQERFPGCDVFWDKDVLKFKAEINIKSK